MPFPDFEISAATMEGSEKKKKKDLQVRQGETTIGM